MKKLFFVFAVLLVSFPMLAGDRDHLTLNGGIMAPYTLSGNIGYEHETLNGNAWEAFAEIGDHWGTPVCHMFFHGYFWSGGGQYKQKLKRLKNGSFRVFGGGQVGAFRTDFFFGIRAGFEYNYVFPNNWEFTLTQINTVNFLKGDTFRNGIFIGFKIPL